MHDKIQYVFEYDTIYVGQSIDPIRRLKQHKSRPSKQMVENVNAYKSFESNFIMKNLFRVILKCKQKY